IRLPITHRRFVEIVCGDAVVTLQKRRRAANAVTRRSHTRIFVRAADRIETARPRSATSGCHSVMPVPRRRGMSRLRAGSFYHPAVTVACEDSAFACRSTAWGKHDRKQRRKLERNGEASFSRRLPSGAAIAVFTAASVLASQAALADEGGVSFWLPGFFGSLAAAPQQPGWSLTSIYYHPSVSAGGNVAAAREFETGRISLNLTANVNASL